MKKNLLTICMVYAVISIQACGAPENNGGDSDTTLTGHTMTDTVITDTSRVDTSAAAAAKDSATFMEQAAIGGMMEIEAGKIAQQKSKNAKVKNFASMMVKDHMKTAAELEIIAKGKHVILPNSLPEKERAHLNQMKQLSDGAFDAHYMNMMVNDHKMTIDIFKAAQTSYDNEVSAFAAKTLKVIETHHKLAQDISGVLKAKK